MDSPRFDPDPEFRARLDAATPAIGDLVLYCPECGFVGPTNTALDPYKHNPPCAGRVRIWRRR